jgi:phosphate transport system substrate-binding protein
MNKPVLSLVTALASGVTFAQQPMTVEPGIPSYQRTAGVSGNINSVGSDTMNNLMALWGESFKRAYPNVKIQIEGKGSSTAPPALIAGTAQFGPMSREMRASEIDQFESKYGYKPTQIRTAYDALAIYVNKDNPLEKITLAQADAVFSKSRRRGGKNVVTWGDLGLTGRRLGRPADFPVRAQLRFGNLRLLQGARPQGRRLPRQRQGAAGLGVGGPGHHRGPLRHGL